MATRVGMVSLGCPKNQVDAEHMLFDLKAEGFELVSDAALADVVIVNTCGFIADAKQEAIDTTLEFLQLKAEGRIKAVIMTGCLAERYREQIMQEMPELDGVVGLGSNDKLVEIIRDIYSDHEPVESFGCNEELKMEGGRIISTEPFYAYLKIAEGCSNFCTYCAIPSIRGKYRSRKIEDIIDEAKWLAENGVTELVVIAQDTTRYGEDNYGKPMLPELLRQLCRIDGLKWIRTLYSYPERLSDELIEVVASEDKLVKYFDIPIQHCNSDILKRMNRQGDEQTLTELLKKIRARIPGVILRTTLIAGFPGETDEQFEQLCGFVKKTRFDRLGAFAYSPEEDTPAAGFDGQIDEDVKQKRLETIYSEQSFIMDEKNSSLVGKSFEVVCEGFDRYAEMYFGRSYMDAPEIDGKIFFISKRKLSVGEYVNVKITDILDFDPIGEVTDKT
ncbi:MAG: 30S ribosomal protein S12 methylthiotransferase RimO [Ruminococcus sp.]|nr:30S ribosomal protein S12 methylthiotransferase RimO [Ruminococcus sp.]MBR1753045.1 30S ribosomal protein S12 methylthiotransferase RimO [Ruminococcus sp.]